MKYSENSVDKKLEGGPAELVVFIVTLILFAPFRIVSEIFKRVLLLGSDNIRKLLLTSAIINIAVFVLASVNSLVVTRNFEIFNGNLPLLSILGSLLMNIGVLFVLPRFSIPVSLNRLENKVKDSKVEHIKEDFDSVSNNSKKEKEEEKREDSNMKVNVKHEPVTVRTDVRPKPPTKQNEIDFDSLFLGPNSLKVDDTFTERIMNSDPTDDDILKNLSSPDSSTDSVYNNKKEERDDIMLNNFFKKFSGRNTSVEDRKDSDLFEEIMFGENQEDIIDLDVDDIMSKAEILDRHAGEVHQEVFRRFDAEAKANSNLH